MNSSKKINIYILSFIAFASVIFLHFYKIGQIPKGLYVDEASAAYDAIMLGRFGVDRWLSSFPVYLRNYGDGQNALYIYIMMIFIKIFGANTFAYRIGMCLSSVFIAIALFIYVKKAFPRNEFLPAISVLIYSITPIFIMPQRYGLESILMMNAAMMVPLFISIAVTKDKHKYLWALLSGIVCGVSLYTYALTYIVVPLFLIFTFIYLFVLHICKKRKNDNSNCFSSMKPIGKIAHFICFSVPLAILAAPLLAIQAINYFDLPEKHIGPFTLTKFTRYRSADLGLQNIKINVTTILHNILIHGDLEANDLSKYGPFFFIAIPFIILGFVICIKKVIASHKETRFTYDAPMLFWFISEYIMGLLLTVKPNSTRMNGIYVSLFYFEITGLLQVYVWLNQIIFKRIYVIVLGIAYLTLSVCFCREYFKENQELGYLFFEPYDEIVEYINENADEPWANRGFTYTWNYMYYMLAHQVNPYEYNLSENTNYVFGEDITNEAEQMNYNYIAKNYIIYKTDTDSFDYLQGIGYDCFSVGEWFLCISPLNKYFEAIGDDVNVSIDTFTDQNESISISGWCYDLETGNTFTGYKVMLEDEELFFSSRERGDVANALSNEALRMSGFDIMLPLDSLRTNKDIIIYGVTKEDAEKLIYSCVNLY